MILPKKKDEKNGVDKFILFRNCIFHLLKIILYLLLTKKNFRSFFTNLLRLSYLKNGKRIYLKGNNNKREKMIRKKKGRFIFMSS